MQSRRSTFGDIPVKSAASDFDPIAADASPNALVNATRHVPPTVQRTGSATRRENTRTACSNTAIAAALATSFLRNENSQETFQQGSLKRANTQQPPRTAPAGPREPKHFTVGNVGQNGKIFLRPVQNFPRKGFLHPPSPPSPDKPEPKCARPPVYYRDDGIPSRWSSSQFSELRPTLIPGETASNDASVATDSAPLGYTDTHRLRSHSFSTISEQLSATDSMRPGEFRIVISRTRDRPKSADGPSSYPALEVPIPHYRLGTPQFNAAGSAILHSSVYTMESSVSDYRYTLDRRDCNDTDPSLSSVHGVQQGKSTSTSILSGTSTMDPTKGCATRENLIFYELKEPVEPAIFEALGLDMDDESVVQYTPGTKDIIAATPARIVAQVSSESFMDYELVSNFFLTFRSYLSTSSLLSLLLARLQWAINRIQADGRIIRIRTFAALRHWILNYFADDFAADYDLRYRFCETINSLYDSVKSRNGGDTSDLKILIDLKRCWQGKLAFYGKLADSTSACQNPHANIFPGNIFLGPGRLCHNYELTPSSTDTPTGTSCSTHNVNDERASSHHDRNVSVLGPNVDSVLLQGDRSIQTASCAPPSKHISTPSLSQKASQPMPLTPAHQDVEAKTQKSRSPIISKHYQIHGHTHKRSGSFSDSVRDDRTPLSSLDPLGPPGQNVTSTCSLIRGTLYPPLESCVVVAGPPSPPLPSPPSVSTNRQSSSNGNAKQSPTSSNMRTIIGSIRRALHSRNYDQSVSQMTGLSQPSLRGKTSAIPTHVALGSDFYRNRKMAALSKKPLRVDTLCDKAMECYREAISRTHEKADLSSIATTLRLQRPLEETSSGADGAEREPAQLHRTAVESQITGGSESVVIVDDTGLGIPAMSGAAGGALAELGQRPYSRTARDLSETPKTASLHGPLRKPLRGTDEFSLPVYYSGTGSWIRGRQSSPSDVLGSSFLKEAQHNSRNSPSWTRGPPSLRLRKYASFQSGISRYRASVDIRTPLGAKQKPLPFSDARSAGPILRRRPGGDLRKMQDSALGTRLSSEFTATTRSLCSSMSDNTTFQLQPYDIRPKSSLIPPNPHFPAISGRMEGSPGRSFADAIAQFAQIPDDCDGGVESTLLKLEGKWQAPVPYKDSNVGLEGRQNFSFANDEWPEGRTQFYYHEHNLGESKPTRDAMSQMSTDDDLTYSQRRSQLTLSGTYSDSIAQSDESYNSIPLLERGLSDDSMKKPRSSRVISTSVVHRTRFSDIPVLSASDVAPTCSSIDSTKETESGKEAPPSSAQLGLALKQHERLHNRFHSISSDTSTGVVDRREALDRRQSEDTSSLGKSVLWIPSHPITHPPSPPVSIQSPRSLIVCATPRNPVLPPTEPLTPDPSPRNKAPGVKRTGRSMDVEQISSDVISRSETGHYSRDMQIEPAFDHMPFILSCESSVLAQQLTLVEMAALREVDWRDLVDMKWSTNSPSGLSWTQFIFDEERKGIDLVVGRFNLVVKWVLSEIVLTRDIHERARTISKFIHTAMYAKQLNNFATMLQITIALCSTDCTRLERTWTCVPEEERNILRNMETLIQPVRNFHDLRIEMETANLHLGCIPFVGLYIHDLTYNAQKPAHITNRDGGALVNFERYRTAARIVKDLLRLIDASTRYNIEPIHGIIERCLWIVSLSEEEIQARSKRLI